MKYLFLLGLLLPFKTFASTVTVGTYNLHGLKAPLALKQDLKALNFVDVWTFQEVEGSFNDRTEKTLQSILPDGTWYTHIERVNLTDSKNQIWEGQAIASRYPIESIEVLPLKHTDKKNRVALIANLKTESGEGFFVTNTDHEVDMFSINMKDRQKQLDSLVEHFKNTNTKGVILGDFNTTEGLKEIKSTENTLRKANFLRVLSTAKDPYTFEAYFFKKELDHIFTRGVQTSERFRYDARRGSDHYPIYTEIQLSSVE